jgi:molecular chaperone DnaK
MVREAEAHAEEDKRRKELVEARNQADAAIYADTRGETEQAITTLKEAMKSEDAQRIRQAMERLTEVAMRLGQAAQSAAGDWGGHTALGRVRCR